MNRIHSSIWTAGALGLALAMIGGCADAQHRQEAFFPAQEARSVDAIARAQADQGARRDAMLRPMHFEGDDLNALGRDKLDRMLRAAASGKLTVYLDLPDAEADKEARRHAVAVYLQEQGLSEAQFAVKDGMNPAVRSSAQEGLTRMPKTEGGPPAADRDSSPQATQLFTTP